MRQLEYMANAPLPLPWMIQRLAGVLIRVLNLIGKTSIFSKSSQLHCVALDESIDRKTTERKLHETQVKNLWFYYVLSCITISHGIAVKWYLRVYWLLPLSIVASFKKHRRFFWKAPTTLLLSTMNTWASSINFFCWAPWILGSFNQLHFLKESQLVSIPPFYLVKL